MEAKHTPGPWQRVDVSTGSATKVEQLCHMGRAALQVQHDGSEEGEANVRLANASPVLLEACKAMVSIERGNRASYLTSHCSYCGKEDVEGECSPRCPVNLARSAIAQAEGGGE